MDNPVPMAKVARRQLLADHVYDELLEALIDGKYEADAVLNIDALARTMDVSQTPIREALARLESTKLVRRTALKGYRVAPILSAADFDELMEARLVVEPENAYLACTNSSAEVVVALDTSIADLKTAARGPSFAEFRNFLEADERFHTIIAEAAENQFLYSAYKAIGGQVQRFRLFAGLGVTDADHAILEHTRIRDAFAAGDPAAAKQQMIEHISNVKMRAARDVGVRKHTS